MKTEKNIAKHLIVGLIYPAVLGTIIYLLLETFGKYILKGESIEFLKSSNYIILLKAVLLIATMTFYACDFLYTTYTNKFRTLYFLFDLIILGGLYATFIASNYDSDAMPQIDKILAYFISFMVLYLLWDGYELIFENKSNKLENMFYKKMVVWEICSLIVFIILHLFVVNNVTIIISTIAIVISTSRFIYLARQKRIFYIEE